MPIYECPITGRDCLGSSSCDAARGANRAFKAMRKRGFSPEKAHSQALSAHERLAQTQCAQVPDTGSTVLEQ